MTDFGPGCVKTPIKNYSSFPRCVEGRIYAGFLDLQFKIDLWRFSALSKRYCAEFWRYYGWERVSSPNCLNQSSDTHDVDEPFQIVRKHMQAHLCTDPFKCSGQKVCGTHPRLDGSKWMSTVCLRMRMASAFSFSLCFIVSRTFSCSHRFIRRGSADVVHCCFIEHALQAEKLQ